MTNERSTPASTAEGQRPTTRDTNYLKRVCKEIDAMTDDELEDVGFRHLHSFNVSDLRQFIDDIVWGAAERLYGKTTIEDDK